MAVAGQKQLNLQTPNSNAPICNVDTDVSGLMDSTGKPITGRLQAPGYVTPAWRYIFAAAAAAAASGSSSSFVFVTTFGADPTGVRDSTTAIQNAINSVGSTTSTTAGSGGGIVWFPPGIYKISNTLTVGNGIAALNSTVNGVQLKAIGTAGAPPLLSAGYGGAVILRWAGPTSGIVVNFAGPMAGWGMEGFAIDATTISAAVGIQIKSASFGRCENNTILGCTKSILVNSWDPSTAGGAPNSMHNTFINNYAFVPNVTGAVGIQLDGGLSSPGAVTTNSAFNAFINTTVQLPNSASLRTGIYLKVCDSNSFHNTHILGGGSGSVGVQLDYSISGNFPNSNIFYGIDNAMATPYASTGTPSANPLFLNQIIGLFRGNAGAIPVGIAGLGYLGGDQIGYTATGIAIGGAVTQTTSITTAVTLNRISGIITTVSFAWTAGAIQQFIVNDSLFAAGDTVCLTAESAGFLATPSGATGGQFQIAITPTATVTTNVVINFNIIKGVSN